MPSPKFPEPPPSIEATSVEACDAALATLHDASARWIKVSLVERILLLQGCIEGMLRESEGWIEAACKAKGAARGSTQEGEEWLAGVMPVIRNLRLLVEALEQGGQPALPSVAERADGQLVARVFPANRMDRALFAGFQADVWIEPGRPASQGSVYRRPMAERKGGVALVLGAGNQASIGPMDALYKLFVEDEVVLLKMNPVNEYLGPFIHRAFAPLVRQGFFDVVYGGAEVGAYLCKHQQVGSIHITGSAQTHDAIVWGTTEEEELTRRKEAGDKTLTKPISSELGCVTPILVVPGPWSEADLEYQARHIASMVVHNASFNCNAGKVVVLPRGWDKTDALMDKIRVQLAKAPARKAYYPGAQQRYEGFLAQYPQAEPIGEQGKDIVPWTLLDNIKPAQGEYALTNEAFCGILATTEVDASEPVTYLERAVALCNDDIWGTLSCAMLVHGKTEKRYKAQVEEAIAALRYGGIGINVWSGVVYGLVCTTWGAFPGHTLEDIISGRGVVHNTFLLDYPQKSVVRAPFRIKPTPAWFYDNRNLAQMGRRLAHFEAAPSWKTLPSVALSALRA